MKELGLYVHIPFCVSKCKYCNFNSYAGCEGEIPRYLTALCKEIKSYALRAKDHTVTTVFIGGGTPSILPSGSVSAIIDTIKSNYSVDSDCEITIEANPNTISLDKAMEWHSAGINRVSVGLQSSTPSILKAIGRTHTVYDYKTAMNTLKRVGFDNINTDLMIGLPSQKQSDLKRAINLAINLGSTHVSCYALILEPNTPLEREVNLGVTKLPSEEKNLNMYNFAYMYLKSKGYHRYEVSNFALKSRECRHNLNTWSMVEYLGFGAGAHGYFDGTRYNNYEGIEQYIKSNNYVENSEHISLDEELEEYIMLGLRKVTGIDLNYIKTHFGVDLQVSKATQIQNLINFGLVKIDNNMLYATDYGFNLLNRVILELV